MPWTNGHIQVEHPREPWGNNDPPELFVHARLNQLKAVKNGDAVYLAAKHEFNMDAAFEVVERCIANPAMDSIIAHVLGGGLDARLVLPHPAFDDDDGAAAVSVNSDNPVNAIPFAYASYLKSRTACVVDEEIVQAARVGRTKLNRWSRFLYQPSFGGAVRPGQTYILVDDVVSTAGTLAALRSYIVRNGGRVLCGTALANAAGKNQPFPLTVATHGVLRTALGQDFELFWRETIGHDVSCLTQSEGAFLGDWCNEEQEAGATAGDDLLQRLRARLDEAAAKAG